jgi:hypothetical protein
VLDSKFKKSSKRGSVVIADKTKSPDTLETSLVLKASQASFGEEDLGDTKLIEHSKKTTL